MLLYLQYTSDSTIVTELRIPLNQPTFGDLSEPVSSLRHSFKYGAPLSKAYLGHLEGEKFFAFFLTHEYTIGRMENPIHLVYPKNITEDTRVKGTVCVFLVRKCNDENCHYTGLDECLTLVDITRFQSSDWVKHAIKRLNWGLPVRILPEKVQMPVQERSIHFATPDQV